MSLRVVTPFLNTNIPGAYPYVVVQSNPVALGASGIVVIMGEADGGPSYEQIPLKNNSFTANQLDLVQQKYISGQIVDAMSALAAPSNDPDITGSANTIFIVKTNTSPQASAVIPTTYGTLTDSNYGANGNLYQYQVLSTDAEVAPTVSGTTVPAFGAPLNGASFTVVLNGGASTIVTLSGTASDHDTIAHLVTELNGLLPAGLTASLGAATNSLKLTMAVDSSAWGKGWGKSLELVDSTPGDLASLGLVAALTVSSQEPVIEVNIVRTDINLNQSLSVSADVALEVGYLGTSATLTIASGLLTTTVSGGTGANLSISMAQYTTILELATFINSQTGYTATCPSSANQLPPSALDTVTAIGINSLVAGLTPGRIKDSAHNFQQALATSVLVFTPGVNGHAGLPAPMATAVFLSGGARGGTAPVDIVNGLAQMAGVDCNMIVPLFSEDATADIVLGVTDPTSTYTIAAINAATKSHCLEYSTPSLKKNRICILSLLGTYAQDAAQAQSLGNYRCSLTMQSVMQLSTTGTIQTYQPWYAAVIAAGMQAGGFYQSITNKAANIISYIDPVGFNSGDPGDVSNALSAGLLFMSNDTGRAGYWVSDQTTYSFDSNFVYNSIQAVYASDLIALDLAMSFFQQFVGKSLADVSVSSGLSFLTQKMDGYFKLKLIGSSIGAPLGFANPKITISAPTMNVSVDIKLATAVYFIPITINVSQIQNSAS